LKRTRGSFKRKAWSSTAKMVIKSQVNGGARLSVRSPEKERRKEDEGNKG
jgi:hypothetical protein